MTKKDEKDWQKLADEDMGIEDYGISDEDVEEASAPETAPSLNHLEPAEMAAALDKAEKELTKYRDSALRLTADMENLKRRTRADLEKAHKTGLKNLLTDLLPVIDSLKKALENIIDADQAAGVKLTLKLFESSLSKYGVEALSPLGEPFNPEFHAAMTVIEAPGVQSNHVVEVLQEGYKLHGMIIRPALVVIAK